MSDYRYQLVKHHEIDCLHVIFDEQVIDADGFDRIIDTHIPLDDILESATTQGFMARGSQASELAQKLLALIERAEQETAQEETPDVDENIYRGIIRYVRLKADIKALCEEQIGKKEQ